VGPARLHVTVGARALPESGTRREVHSESIAGGANALIPRSARRAFLRFRYCRRSRHSPNPVALDVLGRARMGPSDAGDFVMGHAAASRVRSHQAKSRPRTASGRWRPVGSNPVVLLRAEFDQLWWY